MQITNIAIRSVERSIKGYHSNCGEIPRAGAIACSVSARRQQILVFSPKKFRILNRDISKLHENGKEENTKDQATVIAKKNLRY